MCKIKETRQQNSSQKAKDIIIYLQEYTQKFVSRHATKKVVGHEHTIKSPSPQFDSWTMMIRHEKLDHGIAARIIEI